jgi:hypothetical protein
VVRILKQRGIEIARRTVAKYRMELGILASNLRRVYTSRPKVKETGPAPTTTDTTTFAGLDPPRPRVQESKPNPPRRHRSLHQPWPNP